jgi:hypothetical protein
MDVARLRVMRARMPTVLQVGRHWVVNMRAQARSTSLRRHVGLECYHCGCQWRLIIAGMRSAGTVATTHVRSVAGHAHRHAAAH